MSKYTTQFKLSAITAFLERGRGFRRVAAQFQMDPTLLRRWVEAYRLHGEASLSSTGQRYSALFKFSVLRRMWDDSLSCAAQRRFSTWGIPLRWADGNSSITVAVLKPWSQGKED
ncbi:transposase [Pseudomonas sp. NT2]